MTATIKHHLRHVPENDHPRTLLDQYRATFLTDEETRELGRRAKAGDRAARDTLVLAFIPASRNVVRKCVPSQMFLGLKRHYPDICAEAVMGVIDAVAHWRPDDKGTFATAVFWHARVRVWRWIHRNTQPVSSSKYRGAVGVQLDVSEWATMPRADYGGSDPAEQLDAQTVRRLAEQELQHLKPRHRELVQRRLLDDDQATLQELGDEWGLSRERVRQIEAQVLPAFLERLREAVVP